MSAEREASAVKYWRMCESPCKASATHTPKSSTKSSAMAAAMREDIGCGAEGERDKRRQCNCRLAHHDDLSIAIDKNDGAALLTV